VRKAHVWNKNKKLGHQSKNVTAAQREEWMSKLNRRELARLALSGATAIAALLSSRRARAQAWPTRPVMLLIPYPPGGVADPEARLVADRLSVELGQPFVVQNKGGAAGAIATEYVAHAQPDGYTFLFATSAQTTILPLIQHLNYTMKDLMPVSAIAEGPMVLAINSSLPARTLKDFIALVRASPGKYNYGSGGTGSVNHLVSAAFASRLGLDMIHVPYHGGGPAMLDFIAGRLAMYFGNAGELIPHRNDEHLRIIGVSSLQRMPQLPNVPAIAELLPNFQMAAWRGFLAPAGTPQPIVDKVSDLLQRASKDPAIADKITNLGDEVLTTTPAQHAMLIENEQQIFADAVAAAGLKLR
jgi:tripartite-type tricarboxylate transporter receptor subunit TctC